MDHPHHVFGACSREFAICVLIVCMSCSVRTVKMKPFTTVAGERVIVLSNVKRSTGKRNTRNYAATNRLYRELPAHSNMNTDVLD